jgi:hypothetical protein
MTETIQADGTVRLAGSRREIGEALDDYFERGYMLVLGRSSGFYGGGSDPTFCMVELPADFPMRLAEREEWRKDMSVRDAARVRLIYQRKRAAA